MKKNFLKIMLLVLPMLFPGNVKASEPVNVTGFLVDASVVSYMLNNGAAAIKIYAGADEGGNMFYVLVPADAAFNTMPGQVYLQNYKGDCPPSCDYLPPSLAGGGAYIDGNAGLGYINGYMSSHGTAMNCVKLSKATLDKVRNTMPYMKVTFGSSVTVTGLKADGTTTKGGSYTEGSACNCGM